MRDVVNILNEASDTINGPRQQVYGPPKESFQRIADLWSAYLGIDINVVDVVYLMILMKVSRGKQDAERFGDPSDKLELIGKDNPMDIAGYIGCLDMMNVIKMSDKIPE